MPVTKLQEVKWVDACDHTDVELTGIKTSKPFLVERTTYGKIVVNDKDGIVILRDITKEGDCEVTAIPKKMLVSIK